MKRAVWLLVCALLGLALLGCGWLLPMHLRAVDEGVLRIAGRKSPTLIEEGQTLVSQKKLGTAQMLCLAAQQQRIWGQARLASAFNDAAVQEPNLAFWGLADSRLDGLSHATAPAASLALPTPKAPNAALSPDETNTADLKVATNSLPESLTQTIVKEDNREKILEHLRASPIAGVKELMRCRGLTNTSIFPPSQSASGQALDAALAICGLLMEGGQLSAGLSNAVTMLALKANAGDGSEPLEQGLVDLLSLGQRMNWGQLVAFVGPIQDTETLSRLANLVRNADQQLPVIFAAVQLSGQPADVARYLVTFSQTGLQDLGQSLRFGAGAVSELLKQNKRLYSSSLEQGLGAHGPSAALLNFAREYCLQNPALGLTLKWALYLGAGFLLAAGVHFARRPASALERPLQVRGFHLARETLFALGFLVVVLLLSEPFLAQESQRVELPFRLHLPTVGIVVPAGKAHDNSTIMNQLTLLTMLFFFVLQALLYVACLVKLAEIRRQRVPSRVKLRLLENEDHLFDAGLYLGFVGTIISLILVSLNVIKQPSLMAAYSSTSFGIIFVSVFKIFHLRPIRRTLLLEAEASSAQPSAPLAATAFASPS